MSRKTVWQSNFLRGLCALSLVSCASQAFAIVFDDGSAKSPAFVPSSVASMPTIGGGSSITVGSGPTTNIGSFDIVLNPSVALSSNAAALAAFNRAAQNWEAWIADPITVTLDADFSLLGSGILGSTNSVFLQTSYTSIRGAMVTDASDEADDGITAFLPTAAQFTGTVPAGFAFNGNMTATKANLKALGFTGLDGTFGVSDGSIAFSTAFTFDFDKSNGISGGQIDFEGVATHEIGHALGFVSTVDDIDFILPSTSNQIQPQPIDLYRFADNTANDPSSTATFTTAARNFVPGAVDIFDQVLSGFGGSTEVLVSTGFDFGDGRQASHWKDSLGLGIMDPTAANGELLVITQNDLRAFDLIGYEIAVPEASTLVLLMVGSSLSLVGRGRRS
jgi:hypothetical protein